MLYKSDPDPIWMGLSGFDETHLVWKQAGVQESSGPVSGRTSFPLPVFHFQTRLQSSTDSSDHIVQKQHGSELVLADGVRFWPNGSGLEASRWARIIRPASGQCFPADPGRIGHVYRIYRYIYKPPRKETIRSEKSPTENVQQNHKEKQHSKRKFLCQLDIEHSDRIFSQDSQAYDDLPSNWARMKNNHRFRGQETETGILHAKSTSINTLHYFSTNDR